MNQTLQQIDLQFIICRANLKIKYEIVKLYKLCGAVKKLQLFNKSFKINALGILPFILP